MGKASVVVAALYHGQGECWKGIEATVIGVDKKKLRGTWQTTALDFIRGCVDWRAYDIVDLDAYGMPAQEMKECCARLPVGKVMIFTACLSNMGQLPFGILKDEGFSPAQLKVAPIFCSQGAGGLTAVRNCLARWGVKHLVSIQRERHLYGYTVIGK